MAECSGPLFNVAGVVVSLQQKELYKPGLTPAVESPLRAIALTAINPPLPVDCQLLNDFVEFM